jgi:hypothetical protein
MDSSAYQLLIKLHSAGEQTRAGTRSRAASLTTSNLKSYRSATSLKKKESFETTLRAAQVEGAISLMWDKDGFIGRVDLNDHRVLAQFLGVALAQDKIAEAESKLLSHIDRYPVLRDVIDRWQMLKKVRGLDPDSIPDWLDAIHTIETLRSDNIQNAISMPIREISAKLFNNSKRIERLTVPLHVLLNNACDAQMGEPSAVWQELGLYREEQPARLAGNIVIERDRVTATLDRPYSGLPANSIHRVIQAPTMVLSIENLTTFHSEATRLCDEPVLLLYTAGMPSPSWRAMYVRLLQGISITVPVYHWGDIDEGGFRIAATLAKTAATAGHNLLPWKMHPDDVPHECRKTTSAHTLTRIKYFAMQAGWSKLGEAVAEAGFVVEQEALS